VAELLEAARLRLEACGIDDARLDCEVLLAHAMGVDRGRLAVLAAGGALVEVPAASRFRSLVKRRGLREPLAYITGVKEFWSIDLEVTPAVLIPRPESEILVQEALSTLAVDRAAMVVDVGTGSGAVALAVASERPAAFVVGTDVSEAALQVARRNARRHHLGSRVSLVACDLLAGLQPPDLSSNASRHPGRPPCLVVSNPPYVGLSDRGTLMPEVRDHEPAGALFAGEHGMSVIERLVPEAAAWLDTGEWLMMEVGATMAREVAGLISVSGSWQDVSVRDDYAGLPRVVKARRKPRAGESR